MEDLNPGERSSKEEPRGRMGAPPGVVGVEGGEGEPGELW